MGIRVSRLRAGGSLGAGLAGLPRYGWPGLSSVEAWEILLPVGLGSGNRCSARCHSTDAVFEGMVGIPSVPV